MAPPRARPFRLNVHVLPPEASKDLAVKPEERFLQITNRETTIQDLCINITRFFRGSYGRCVAARVVYREPLARAHTDDNRELDIKKCQTADGSDLGLDLRVEYVFDDRDVIRVIQSSTLPSIRDSVPPTSGLRPGIKRGRSQSVRPALGRITEEQPLDQHLDNPIVPPLNKKRKLGEYHPDEPIRSRERDLEGKETGRVHNYRPSVTQVRDSLEPQSRAQGVPSLNGSTSVRTITPVGLSSTPPSSPAAIVLRSFLEIEDDPTDFVTTKIESRNVQNLINGALQQSLGSPFQGSLRDTAGTDRYQQNKSSFRRKSYHIEHPTIRERSVSTPATTPLSIEQQPPRGDAAEPMTNGLKRPAVKTLQKLSSPQHSNTSRAASDVYDEIETDDEGAIKAADRLKQSMQVNHNGTNGAVGKSPTSNGSSSTRQLANSFHEQPQSPGKPSLAPKSSGRSQQTNGNTKVNEQSKVHPVEPEPAEQPEQLERRLRAERARAAAENRERQRQEEETRVKEQAEKASRLEEGRNRVDEEARERQKQNERRKSVETERQKSLRADHERKSEERRQRKEHEDAVKLRREQDAEKKRSQRVAESAERAHRIAQKAAAEVSRDSKGKSKSVSHDPTIAAKSLDSESTTFSPALSSSQASNRSAWDPADSAKLVKAKAKGHSWEEIAALFKNKTSNAVRKHYAALEKKPGGIEAFLHEDRSSPAQAAMSTPDSNGRRVSRGSSVADGNLPSSALRRESSSTKPYPKGRSMTPAEFNAYMTTGSRSSQAPSNPDVSLDAQVPLPPSLRRSVSFADDSPSAVASKPEPIVPPVSKIAGM
jgi:hypothetical protein